LAVVIRARRRRRARRSTALSIGSVGRGPVEKAGERIDKAVEELKK
jgi:hypothetical protein